ncbi:MAG: Spy/CpxP family protein refolding chaperone [Candidatus Omnitrophica bacterium]|nr:Spy/CpxP family protein refolding chaperone [Candidatus Omnitrophota bacterium]
MKKLRNALLGIIGVYVFATLSLAQAQDVQGPFKAHSGQGIQELYSKLNLTDAQKQQLETNKQQHRARMEKARQEMKTDKEALHGELMKPQLDMARVKAIHNQIKSIQSGMEDDKLSSILTVRAILTPEQFSNFVTLMHKHKQTHDQGSAGRQENEAR